MKKSILISSLIVLGCTSTSLAQTKAVVIPLNSNRAVGTDGQVQYNDSGKPAGAEVYYKKSSGKVGIGTNAPTEQLEVNGNVKADSFIGDGSGLTGVVGTESDPTVPASVKDGTDWTEVTNRPAGLDDGDDVGVTTESDPTVTESVKDGIDWSEITGIPAGIADGDDVGITTETDPTVPASVKDGTDWTEVTNRPSGLDDGDDVGLTSESDPKVGTNVTNYVSKWDGASLVQGSIYDNGSNIGIGTSAPSSALEVRGEIRSTDSNGNNRLWGKGRPDVRITISSWNATPLYPNIEYAYSDSFSRWDTSETVCPAKTWVCSFANLAGGTLIDIPSYNRVGCNGALELTNYAWIANQNIDNPNGGISRFSNLTNDVTKCASQRVWCCRETVTP